MNPQREVVEWDRSRQACVKRPPSPTLTPWAELEEDRRRTREALARSRDDMEILVANFVNAVLELDNSMRSRNLNHLFADEEYRRTCVAAAREGYEHGRADALARWRDLLSEFLDQLRVVGTNMAEDPANVIVGLGLTAIQKYGKEPFKEIEPAGNERLNAWLRAMQRQLWGGKAPPPMPELPDDDLARSKADFAVSVLATFFSVVADPSPASKFFATLSLSEIAEAYSHWQAAEDQAAGTAVDVLLDAICDPEAIGYNLAYYHGAADVNTAFMVSLRFSEWFPVWDMMP